MCFCGQPTHNPPSYIMNEWLSGIESSLSSHTWQPLQFVKIEAQAVQIIDPLISNRITWCKPWFSKCQWKEKSSMDLMANIQIVHSFLRGDLKEKLSSYSSLNLKQGNTILWSVHRIIIILSSQASVSNQQFPFQELSDQSCQ